MATYNLGSELGRLILHKVIDMKLPETLAGCEAHLALLEPEVKKAIAHRFALVSRIADLKRVSSVRMKPARAASAKGGAVNSDTVDLEEVK